MRTFNKYKSWSKVNTSGFFPLRILKFKKTKWRGVKKLLLKVKNKNLFLDHTIRGIQSKTWERIKNYYKNKLRYNLSLKQRYDYKLPNQKEYSKEKTFFLKNYVKNEYRVDFLLYSLNLFASVYQARQYIKNGCVLVNNKLSTKELRLLRQGDIVSVLKINNNQPPVLRKELRFSFLEVDYYTQTIVVLKNLTNINMQDVISNFNEKSQN